MMEAVLLECTLDDVTGEQLAHAMAVLLEGGAADAHALFGIGKKGRPLFVLRTVCARVEAGKFARIMARETGTMGVKEIPFRHIDLEKKFSTRGGVLRKSTKFSSKMEFESLRRKSRELGVPLRKLSERLRKRKRASCSSGQALLLKKVNGLLRLLLGHAVQPAVAVNKLAARDWHDFFFREAPLQNFRSLLVVRVPE